MENTSYSKMASYSDDLPKIQNNFSCEIYKEHISMYIYINISSKMSK